MISDKMASAISTQINRELYSAYLYLGMSAWFSDNDLAGFANWMRIQFDEEQFHAMKMYDYLVAQGAHVALGPIEAPPNDYASAIDVFEKTLAHERTVTGLVNKLVDLAQEQKDHATNIFLQWFITEQIEEEANATEILRQLKLVGKEGHGLLMLDREMAQRVFTPPAAAE